MPLYDPEEAAKVGGRDYAEKQNAGVADAPQGALAKVRKGIGGKIPTNTDDLTKLASEKILGKYAESGTGKAITSLAQDAKNIALIWTGDFRGVWPLIKKHWKILAVMTLVPGLIFVGIGAAIGQSLSHVGDLGSNVPAPANGILIGGYCAGMQPTLDWKTSANTVEHLTLYGTEGVFSSELAYDAETKNGGAPSLDSYRSQDPKSPNYYPDSWKQYYASARMGFTASPFAKKPLSHTEAVKTFPGLPEPKSYASRRLIFYNPANGKAAVTIASDWGANTRIFTDRSTENISKKKALWEGAGSRNGLRIDDPPGDTEQTFGGGGPWLSQAIGAHQGTPIKMGFASDQSIVPGSTFVCKVLQNTVTPSPTTASPTVVTGNEKKP